MKEETKSPMFIRSVALTLDERIALTSLAMKQGKSVAQYVEDLIRAALNSKRN